MGAVCALICSSAALSQRLRACRAADSDHPLKAPCTVRFRSLARQCEMMPRRRQLVIERDRQAAQH